MIQKDVTLLLQAVCSGDRAAYGQLYEAVYAELRRVAAANMRRESPGHTLQPTALVNEAYLRLAPGVCGLENRRHFFGAAAEAMRRILVEHARRRLAGKRGAGLERVTLSGLDVPADEEGSDVLDIDAALEELGRERPRLAELVKLRYFAGMSIEEAAEAQGTSPATAKRDWAFARAWLAERVESRRGA
ncbi:MAG TPA: sigma-70 family RNA polymerase sigma factor [Steroidobacteraceae bacterium]